ncbi:diguanylate cyclase/phosphodiesterase [Shewanella morhuae]|uniref:putative bifunctional diguanylate cyclase/phosphodiesterase n=1 Tax=Shewanella morhuae TaxID=365591 RepID=UPI000955F5B0|nr:bifunctional diguanylate cyclase/phosphodiesterase [Shewanella morhuae]SIQ44573.1 diguanylate cyclase/phosphodiesterase [Shewanella morhuae]
MLIIGLVVATLTLLIVLLYLLQEKFRTLRSQQQFLAQLCFQLEQQNLERKALNITIVPQEFAALYHSLNELLKALPANVGKDKLTGLANRVGLKRALTAMMPLTQGTIVLIDIYRFRYVSDLFGFVFGDMLLKQFAERVNTLNLAPRLVARLNGDEFFLYYEQTLSEEQLVHLRGRLQVPFNIKGRPLSVKLQIGCVHLQQHYADTSQMLRRADLALKKARNTRSAIAFYAKNDDIRQLRELKIVDSLPKCLLRNQLYMVYQAKQDIATGRCFQVEALMRWEHDELGFISPSEFIPLAEYAGMIDLVSQWALEQVLAQQAKWRAAGMHLCVAVNLSTRDLDSDTLPQDIAARLAHYQLPPESLMIEITESTLMTDLTKAVKTLTQLRAIGVKLAIDDFGTGHSSLAYLKHLPVNEVKIDKAFLQDLGQDKPSEYILEASINIAKKLGYEVTVEGIETLDIRDMLVAMGVDTLQGMYYAKPMRAAELETNWEQLHNLA